MVGLYTPHCYIDLMLCGSQIYEEFLLSTILICRMQTFLNQLA